MPTSLL
jgi:hypothetical protein